jgi:hypothetical protein
MFGVGGLAWWLGEFRSGAAGKPRLGKVRLPDGDETSALVLPVRAAKVRTAIIMMAAFSVGALIFALSPEPLGDRDNPVYRIVMLAIGVFLGVLALRGMSAWRRGESYLALTPQSLAIRAATGGFAVPWEEIVEIRVFSAYGQPQLGIRVGDVRKIQDEGLIDTIARFERPLTGNDRSIWLGGFAASSAVVAGVIRDYAASPEKRVTLGRDAIPATLLLSSSGSDPGITSEEKRHARSLGRWPAALLITAQGVFVWAVVIRVSENLIGGSAEARGATAVALTLAVAGLLGIVGLAHFGAAVAIVLRREVGRKMGLRLSVIGIAIGVIGAAVALATGAERAWALVLVLAIGYSLSWLLLHLLGDLSHLTSPSGRRPIRP